MIFKKIILFCWFNIGLNIVMYAQEIKFVKKPEFMKYLVHYGILDGGEMELKVSDTLFAPDNRVCHKVSLTGKTIGSVDWFAHINNVWTSYIDTASGLPYQFVRDIHENKYTKFEKTIFDRVSSQAYVTTRIDSASYKIDNFRINAKSQDMISAYFAFRFYDFEDVRKKDTLSISVFFEDKLYNFKMRYLGKEKVKTIFGKKTKAIVISPILPPNSIFSGKDAIKAYFSDDGLRLPLKIKASLWVGSAEVDLVEYK